MKNKHMFKMSAQSGQRYRFVLPEDERNIKLLAFVQGMMNASIQKEHGYKLSKEAIEAGSIDAALQTEQEVKNGKQGCNEPEQFRALFADRCARIHLAVLEYWNNDPAIWKTFQRRPEQQKIANASQIAELFLDKVETCIAMGLPIQFDR